MQSSGLHGLEHDRLFTHVLDLLDHIQLFVVVALVGLERNRHLRVGDVSSLVLSPGNRGHLAEFGPVLALVDLGPAGEDSLDELDLFGLDYVALLVTFDDLLECAYHLTVSHCHSCFNYSIIK